MATEWNHALLSGIAIFGLITLLEALKYIYYLRLEHKFLTESQKVEVQIIGRMATGWQEYKFFPKAILRGADSHSEGIPIIDMAYKDELSGKSILVSYHPKRREAMYCSNAKSRTSILMASIFSAILVLLILLYLKIN
jgi:hypothetical protein